MTVAIPAAHLPAQFRPICVGDSACSDKRTHVLIPQAETSALRRSAFKLVGGPAGVDSQRLAGDGLCAREIQDRLRDVIWLGKCRK
jgi:hypothetical protein